MAADPATGRDAQCRGMKEGFWPAASGRGCSTSENKIRMKGTCVLRHTLLMIPVLLLAGCTASEPDPVEVRTLVLLHSLPIDGPVNFQPSGLAIWEDALLTVSDRHDHAIYRLDWNLEGAALSPYLEFEPPESDTGRQRMDFEGITVDGDGHFYLVSETLCRVMRVQANDGTAQWVSPDMTADGQAAGLFQIDNAYLEGIALVNKGRFLLCAERQPRGIIEADFNQSPPFIRAVNCDESRFTFPEGTTPDFSDICFYQGTVYVLQRNAYLVASLRLGMEGCEEVGAWSYAHIERDPRWEYVDMRYGHGEGLVMDDDYLYIVLDNNGDPRSTNPGDSRPLLFVFENPLKKRP